MYNIHGIYCVYNITDSICLVQMSVQYTWQYMCSTNECTIYLTVGLVQMSVQYTWQYTICLGQMSVQYTWHYMFSSNECTI